MKTNKTLLFLLSIFSQIIFGQTFSSKEIKGQVFADSIALQSVTIVNNTTQHFAVTDYNGLFSIVIHENDVLVFSGVNLEVLEKRIRVTDLSLSFLSIQMKTKSIELEQVFVNSSPSINAVSLGLVSSSQKKYTAAERKLYTAGEFKWYSPLLIPLGGMDFDGLLNAVNGRKKSLKKELSIENKETAILLLQELFDQKYLIRDLKIPSNHVAGFQYYVVENQDFMKILNSENKIATEFLLVELAQQYKNTITIENE